MDIQIINQHQLSPHESHQLEVLMANCRQQDGNVVPVYPHILMQYRMNPCSVLCFYQQQLIGFLSVFFFYEDACEIALMIAPTFRRQGIASRLFKIVLPIIHMMQMKKIYFSLPKGGEHAWTQAYGGHYHSSEYQMLRSVTTPIAIAQKRLEIRPAVHSDLPILCALDAACFATPTLQAETRFARLLDNSEYSLYLATQYGVPVGKAHICWQSHDVRMTDIAISPRMQGQGLGRELMAHCINLILTKQITDIRLDVETLNTRALHLYEGLDFKTINAYEYWVIDTPESVS